MISGDVCLYLKRSAKEDPFNLLLYWPVIVMVIEMSGSEVGWVIEGIIRI